MRADSQQRAVHSRPLLQWSGAVAVITSLVLLIAGPLPAFGDTHQVTICHAAGQVGTEQFVTLTLPFQAVYGNAGHLNEDGTAQAGHENDHLGPCVVETTTTTQASTTTTQASTTTTEATTTTASATEASTTTTISGGSVTSTLPFTGVDSGAMAGLALSLMAAGTAAVVFGSGRAKEPIS